MAYNKYPMTSFNEYNLDWLIEKYKELDASMTDFEALHSITFGGDWDISKQYKAWTIVSDPITHDGYLSLQPVPNNVYLTDTNYWLQIADYTTGLAAVNTRVDNVEDDITNNIKPDITALQNDVTNIDTVEIPAIQNDINTINNTDLPAITNDITNLQNDVAALQGTSRKILLFGDSYFMDNPPSGEQSFRDYIEPIIADIPDVEIEIHADGGEGFGNSGIYSFTYDVNNYTPVFDPDEITDVFFVGGYNDRNNSDSDIKSGMIAAFTAARTAYPKAKISVGFFGWDSKLSSTDRDDIVFNALKNWQLCTDYGASFMTNSEYTMHNYDLFYTYDNFHPNGNGHHEIAKQIVQYILTGSCDVHYPFKQLQFNQGDITAYDTNDGYNIGFKLDNDIVTFYPPNDIINFNTTRNLSTSGYAQMIQITTMISGYRGYAIGMYDSATSVKEHLPINGFLILSGGEYRELAPCNLTLSGGFLHIRPYGINSDRDNFDTYTGVTGVNMIGGAISIPTLSC